MSERAVALLSGGMDSAVAAAWARAEGHPLVALTVDYGQRQRAELAAATAVARWLGVAEHVLLRVDLRAIGGSALTADIPVPEGRPRVAGEIPATYVPARNTLLLALALALAETRNARLLLLGVNRIDYSGYPDCRPEFLAAFERLAALGTRAGAEGERFRIAAPLIDLSKAEIVRLGSRLGVPFDATLSCYDPLSDGRHCGRCDSCRLRCAGFAEAGLPDPTNYARMPS